MGKPFHVRGLSACGEQLGVRCFAQGHFNTGRWQRYQTTALISWANVALISWPPLWSVVDTLTPSLASPSLGWREMVFAARAITRTRKFEHFHSCPGCTPLASSQLQDLLQNTLAGFKIIAWWWSLLPLCYFYLPSTPVEQSARSRTCSSITCVIQGLKTHFYQCAYPGLLTVRFGLLCF